METHVRVLGYLHIVFAALGILAALVILGIFGGAAAIVHESGDADAAMATPIVAVVGGAIAVLVLILSVPGIVAGIGLLQFREWARILTIVLSCFELLSVPFGTALGVYGLVILLNQETAGLFRRANPARPV